MSLWGSLKTQPQNSAAYMPESVDLLDALFSKMYEKLDLGEIEVADPSYTNLYEG